MTFSFFFYKILTKFLSNFSYSYETSKNAFNTCKCLKYAFKIQKIIFKNAKQRFCFFIFCCMKQTVYVEINIILRSFRKKAFSDY